MGNCQPAGDPKAKGPPPSSGPSSKRPNAAKETEEFSNFKESANRPEQRQAAYTGADDGPVTPQPRGAAPFQRPLLVALCSLPVACWRLRCSLHAASCPSLFRPLCATRASLSLSLSAGLPISLIPHTPARTCMPAYRNVVFVYPRACHAPPHMQPPTPARTYMPAYRNVAFVYPRACRAPLHMSCTPTHVYPRACHAPPRMQPTARLLRGSNFEAGFARAVGQTKHLRARIHATTTIHHHHPPPGQYDTTVSSTIHGGGLIEALCCAVFDRSIVLCRVLWLWICSLSRGE